MKNGNTEFDELVLVSGPEAIEAAKTLAMKEGIFCGISSGASFASALKIAAKAPKGSLFFILRILYFHFHISRFEHLMHVA